MAELTDELAQAIRMRLAQEKQDAYAQGWRDAVAAMANAAASMTTAPLMRGANISAAKKPPREQSAQWFLLETLKSQPSGIGTYSLFDAAMQNGCKASIASLRVAISRLREKGFAKQADGNWFPV